MVKIEREEVIILFIGVYGIFGLEIGICDSCFGKLSLISYWYFVFCFIYILGEIIVNMLFYEFVEKWMMDVLKCLFVVLKIV